MRLFSGLTALCAAALFTSQALAAPLILATKSFTEQHILSAMTVQYLQKKGFQVQPQTNIATVISRNAMINKQIDMTWEYTGTSLITYNNIEDKLDPQQTYDTVKELDAEKGIVWLDPSEANNTYALAMRAADSTEKGIATISDLAGAMNDGQGLTFGSNAEFYARPDGLKPLEETYGFEFGRANVKRMDTGLVYQALRDGQVDVGLVFATDGRIPAFDFTVLEDDQGYFPSYALAPVIRAEVLEANPDIGDLLNEVSAKLDDQVMAALNASVDVDKVSVENAAAKFLQDHDLN